MNPNFEVPPEYFYALAASLPVGVSAADRYTLATRPTELGLAAQLQQAIDAGIIAANAGVTPLQAARRLTALGKARAARQGGDENGYTVRPADAGVYALIQQWLAAADPAAWADLPDPDEPVWRGLLTPPATHVANDAAQLRLIACALTGWDDTTVAILALTQFVAAIGAPLGVPPGSTGLNVSDADDLAGVSADAWTEFFTAHPQFLPPFTQPAGTAVSTPDRITSFLRHLQRFYTVPPATPTPIALAPGSPPLLDRYGFDPLASFLVAYDNANPAAYVFGISAPGDAAAVAAATTVFPNDAEARRWLLEALQIVYELVSVTGNLVPGGSPNASSLEFSIVEALYSRGFTSIGAIVALDQADFTDSLIGTVAFQWAAQIWNNAGGVLQPPPPAGAGFTPIDPDGSLSDCIPPAQLSPLGPVEYLHELLEAGPDSTCEQPTVVVASSFAALLVPRRGDLGSLHVTGANLKTPLPVIDLVNECLEYLAATVAASATGTVTGIGGVVYDTAADRVRDHLLRPPDSRPQPGPPYHHDPAAVLAALPEHSSPASPVGQPGGYAALASDFSSPALPYSQPLDLSRSHLAAMGTKRYETMRRFRTKITEFVLGTNPDPARFDTTVWRYPVRRDIAPEYLCSTPEYRLLFAAPIATSSRPRWCGLPSGHLYGFANQTTPMGAWTNVVITLSEFLRRTGLSYCEFIELWRWGFVAFHRARAPGSGLRSASPAISTRSDRVQGGGVGVGAAKR